MSLRYLLANLKQRPKQAEGARREIKPTPPPADHKRKVGPAPM